MNYFAIIMTQKIINITKMQSKLKIVKQNVFITNVSGMTLFDF